MKLDKLFLETYGKLVDREIMFDRGINIILGDNEAGKSTLFNSIETLLYGFFPANREQHPYVNWALDEIAFRGYISDGDAHYEVFRQLKAAPKYQLLSTENGEVTIGRNEALPWTCEVSRVLYRSVYHLSAERLVMLEHDSWEQIQEKLVFNYGVNYLNKTSDVLETLNQDIKRIWRPDRRGTPELSVVEKELRTLERERHQYERNYEQLNEYIRLLGAVINNISELEQKKKILSQKFQDLNHLLPLKEKMMQLEQLKTEMISVAYFNRMPEDSLTRYETLKARLNEMTVEMDDIAALKSNVENQLKTWSENEKRIEALGDEIKGAQKFATRYEQLQTEIDQSAEVLNDRYSQMELAALKLFESVDEALMTTLKNLDILALKVDFNRLMDMKEKNEQARMRQFENTRPRHMLHIILFAIGIAGIILGLTYSPALWVGLVLFGIGISEILYFRKQITLPYDPETVISEIKTKFTGIPLPDYIWDDTGYMFITALAQIKDAFESIESLSKQLNERVTERNRQKAYLSEALLPLNIETTVDVLKVYGVVSDKLKQIEIKRHAQEIVMAKFASVCEREKTSKAKYAQLNDQFKIIKTQFLELGKGDLTHGLAVFQMNLDKKRRMAILEETLENQRDLLTFYQSFKDKTLIDPVEIKKIVSESEMIDNEIRQAYIEKNRYEQHIETIKKDNKLDEIDSECRMKEELRTHLLEKRDQLMVLKTLIQHADEVYRKTHQPDILKRVSVFMAKMTHGKYQQVIITEGFELQFIIAGNLYPISKAFSKGTLNQLFLSFRLAVIEKLSENGMHLPIVLDEALINWDRERLKATFDVLEEVAKHHQIFIFTCHSELYDSKYHMINLENSL